MTDNIRTNIDYAAWVNPQEVPSDMTILERTIIAARNIRLWSEWLLEATGPAPEKGHSLVDVMDAGEAGES